MKLRNVPKALPLPLVVFLGRSNFNFWMQVLNGTWVKRYEFHCKRIVTETKPKYPVLTMPVAPTDRPTSLPSSTVLKEVRCKTAIQSSNHDKCNSLTKSNPKKLQLHTRSNPNQYQCYRAKAHCRLAFAMKPKGSETMVALTLCSGSVFKSGQEASLVWFPMALVEICREHRMETTLDDTIFQDFVILWPQQLRRAILWSIQTWAKFLRMTGCSLSRP